MSSGNNSTLSSSFLSSVPTTDRTVPGTAKFSPRAVIYYFACFAFTYLGLNFALSGLFFGFLLDSGIGFSFAPGAALASIIALVYFKRIKVADLELFRREAIYYYLLAMAATVVIASCFGWAIYAFYPNKLAVVSFVGSHALLALAMLLIELSEVNARK
ncbi:MAG: hypothetical protein LR015_07030 [Verrucomicrobia bacterium]|nr:hypothetical protein [Verrucomicrobiota bacterium]